MQHESRRQLPRPLDLTAPADHGRAVETQLPLPSSTPGDSERSKNLTKQKPDFMSALESVLAWMLSVERGEPAKTDSEMYSTEPRESEVGRVTTSSTSAITIPRSRYGRLMLREMLQGRCYNDTQTTRPSSIRARRMPSPLPSRKLARLAIAANGHSTIQGVEL